MTRLWLHAATLTVPHPDGGASLTVQAPLGPEWQPLAPGAPS